VHGFTSDRTEFLGIEVTTLAPRRCNVGDCRAVSDLGADPCAALQIHIDLAPGEEWETHFILGQSSNREEALKLVARFRAGEVVEAAWKGLHTYWDGVLGTIRVRTPEPSMDLMLNRWLLYQTLSSRIFGRTGFYQSSGAFGYRDQLQDVLALLHSAPSLARAHILNAAQRQFEEGDVLHWVASTSGRGVRTRCSDDMAWLPYVTGEYVAATGDTGILEESVPFLAGKPLQLDEHDRYAQYETSAASAPLFEHCRRALEFAVTAGAHGLPLMRDGDWNDGMSRVGVEGRGESVWLGWFLCAAMERFAALSSVEGIATPRRIGVLAATPCARRSKTSPGMARGICALFTTTAHSSDPRRVASAESTPSPSRGRYSLERATSMKRDRGRPCGRPTSSSCARTTASCSSSGPVRQHTARPRIHSGVPTRRSRERRPIYTRRDVARLRPRSPRRRTARRANLSPAQSGSPCPHHRRLRALSRRALRARWGRLQLSTMGRSWGMDVVHGGRRLDVATRSRRDPWSS